MLTEGYCNNYIKLRAILVNRQKDEGYILYTARFQEFLQKHSIHVLSFDRAGYGQSDPNPGRGLESEARDIEQIADLLGFGDTFYLLTESIGGYSGWSCLKYIPER